MARTTEYMCSFLLSRMHVPKEGPRVNREAPKFGDVADRPADRRDNHCSDMKAEEEETWAS